ncbi:hypothetical protein EYF80_057786 [Liparis tanakae]|uniref:Uncharacterized protein n=1 Tax=Liparis tanakae TaxID=230148 RepID=A0A4Z2EUK4_9TELE|nr:hypothetical protein EYF80_057786 [Liparis tanakae]
MSRNLAMGPGENAPSAWNATSGSNTWRGISDSLDWQFMKTRRFTFTSWVRTCRGKRGGG